MEPNNNDNNNNTVSFANEDVEDQSANTTPVTRKSSTELRDAKDRKSLSQSAKAWDLDGDGELDDAELALKNMDSSHKGTLSKDQMYKLMTDNLQTQRELFKVKKVVIGLVVFTCILAISNLGTSLAAAFLAKDTKVNQSDELTSSSTGRTLATDTMTTTFTIDPEFDQEFTRRHRHLCANAGGGGIACTITAGSAVNFDDGKDIANKCAAGKSVSITKTFGSSNVIHSNICPVSDPDGLTSEGSGNNPKTVRITRRTTGIIDIIPESDGSAYTITGLTSSPGQACSTNADCLRGELPNTTNPDHVCERANAGDEFGVCKANPGRTCTTAGTSECTENFTCEGVAGCEGCGLTCVCASDLACDAGFTCSAGTNGGKFCQCTDGACGEGGLCTTECNNPDATKSCTTQKELDDSCFWNYGLTTCGDNKLCVTPPEDGVVVALPVGEGR